MTASSLHLLSKGSFLSPFWLDKMNQLTGFYLLETFLGRVIEKENLHLHTRFTEFVYNTLPFLCLFSTQFSQQLIVIIYV